MRVALRDAVAEFNHFAQFATLAALAAVLTGALVLQYGDGELPCPLCLLQRVAMLGVAWGLASNFRWGFSTRNLGLSLVWAVFQLVVGVRQVLLDIYPRPGHAYPGGTVLGLHLPVWSTLIAVGLIASFAAELAICDEGVLRARSPRPRLATAGRVAGLYILALAAVNLVSAVVQCGFGVCHTTGYKL